MSDPASVDKLLRSVHKRLGGLGVNLLTFGDGRFEVRWKRSYSGVWSDERVFSSDSLTGTLQGILAHEDRADAEDTSYENEDDLAPEDDLVAPTAIPEEPSPEPALQGS